MQTFLGKKKIFAVKKSKRPKSPLQTELDYNGGPKIDYCDDILESKIDYMRIMVENRKHIRDLVI